MNMKSLVWLPLLLVVACGKEHTEENFRLQGEWEQYASSAPMKMLMGGVAFGDGDSFYFGLGNEGGRCRVVDGFLGV